MKLYILDDYKKEKKKKLNKKKLVKTIVIAITIIVLIVLAAFYIGNEKFRGFIDRYVLRKEITENTGNIIQISQEDNPYVYTYDKYITVLNKNLLEHYNSNANLEFSVKVSISTPLFASNGKYLVLAEKGGQKLYLISGQNIIWQKDIEGNIVNVNVNKNGYVSIIITGTIYKTNLPSSDQIIPNAVTDITNPESFVWYIAKMNPKEVRQLTYYVKLKDTTEISYNSYKDVVNKAQAYSKKESSSKVYSKGYKEFTFTPTINIDTSVMKKNIVKQDDNKDYKKDNDGNYLVNYQIEFNYVSTHLMTPFNK